MKSSPVSDIPEEQTDTSYSALAKSFDADKAKLGSGFAIAGPRFASAAEPLARGKVETIAASLGQGLTANIFGGFKVDYDATVDPDFNARDYMRPGDEKYAAQITRIPNNEVFREFQLQIDRRNEALGIIAARPYTSFGAQLLDPVTLGVDLLTYGLGHAVTLPLLANAARRTETTLSLAKSLQQVPKVNAALKEAYVGGQAGALSMGIQTYGKAKTNDLETIEEIGDHIMFGSLIGMALGGAVGYFGKGRTDKLTDDFVEANRVTQEASAPPPEFVGPPPPTNEEAGLLSTGKKPEIRAQAKAAPKRTKEEIKAEANQRRLQVDEELPERKAGYESLRVQLAQIGENFGEKMPPLVKKALSLVTWPIRNLSATNRALSSSFGSLRLFAIGMARNATEFAGTRKGFVLPRSAQNRIEDIGNHAIDVLLDVHQMYMKANKIDPGAFSAEKLALGKSIYDETQFYSDVSDQMLHVGKPSEKRRGANPHVQQAARHVYESFYKPYGELLKEYGLIKPDASVDEVLNYLNRHWKTSKLLSDPEGFKTWLADFFDKQNEKLKSIRPQYDKALNDARTLRRDAKRFQKAADKIEKIKSKIESGENEKKIEEVKKENIEYASNKQKEYDEERKSIAEKYEKAKENPSAAPDISATKKIIKDEIKSARDDRDALTKEFNEQEAKTKAEITAERTKLKEIKQSVNDGKKDKFIIEEVIKADVQRLLDDPKFAGYTVEQINDIAKESAIGLGEAEIKQLRRDYLSNERLLAQWQIEESKAKLRAIKEEKKSILDINRQELDKNISELTKLLEEESKLSGKQSKEGKINKLLNVREKLELKYIDLKEKHAVFKHEVAVSKKINKLNEPIQELEFMQRKFSRAGLEAFYTRKANEKIAPHLKKDARKAERKAIKNAQAVDEAQTIADELLEGAEMELQRAEAMIPDELRSNTTGKPYRVYDSELEPTYAYSQAEKTFYTMIGQEDEIVLNPVFAALGGGEPSVFKARNIKMADDYPGIENWVERDIRVLMNQFASGISPPIALTELMHELNKMPIVQQTMRRMQIADKKISAEKLIDMPSEMQNYNEIPKVFATMMREEFKMQSEGLTGKELQKLLDEYQAAEKNLATIDKEIKGVMANGVNVNSRDFSDFVDIFNSAVSTVTTNNIVISMLSDLMGGATRYGYDKYINGTLRPLLADGELKALHVREAKALHTALKVAQGSVIKNRISGREGSLKNSAFGKFASNLANRMGNWTGSNGMQDMMETAATVLIKTNLLDMAERVVAGTATQKELTHLAQRAISPAKAKRIHNFYKRYGFEKDGTKGIDPALLENISAKDAKAYFDYQAFINDDLKTILVKPGVGSLPDFSYTPYGKSVMFLKKYFFAATNDLLIPAVQRADKEAAQGFTGMFAIGALQSELRKIYRGEERKEFDLEVFIAEALTNSALPGIYTFGVDLSVASGLIAGAGGSRYDPSGGVAALIGGPGVIGFSGRTLNILGKMRKIMTDEDKQFTYKEWNAIANTYVPLYKWAPISSVVKPNLKEYFESQGRGGE